MENNKEYLYNGLKSININADEEKINKLLQFMNIVIRENEKINLTTIIDEKEFIEKHIIDSAAALKYLKNNSSVIDIGSGAGMPGIIFKILNNTLDITLLDSLNKRVTYLNNTIKELSLDNIKAIHARAEELAHDDKYRQHFDYSTARAVARLNTLLEYTMPFVKVGGKFIALKAEKGEEELKHSSNALKCLCGEIDVNDKFLLPYSKATRDIIVVNKIKPNIKAYPRKQNKIKKSPL